MTWKPTEEMRVKASVAYHNWRENRSDRDALEDALIAVQPLIAAEATAPLKAELEASMAEIARLRLIIEETYLAIGEARAMALEEAAECAGLERVGLGDNEGDIAYNLACEDIENAIRSLIPKPVEGA